VKPRRFRKWAAEFIVSGAAVIAFALVLALIGIIASGGWPGFVETHP
jgi:hypothetical protein